MEIGQSINSLNSGTSPSSHKWLSHYRCAPSRLPAATFVKTQTFLCATSSPQLRLTYERPVFLFFLYFCAHKRLAIILKLSNCAKHLSIDNLALAHGSVRTDRATGTWNFTLPPTSPEPFNTDETKNVPVQLLLGEQKPIYHSLVYPTKIVHRSAYDLGHYSSPSSFGLAKKTSPTRLIS